ncbi:lipoate--protein ligase family protein [Bifidobacterium aesculapii]|uniref:lipoate--protein ligase family protein n=1 Tax=Bifidobacterium aesculapii TaxID=1329411 RepID=UPI00146FF979|nr:lipoate--protein ligase family protein [Bifidobacterium aesculapii]
MVNGIGNGTVVVNGANRADNGTVGGNEADNGAVGSNNRVNKVNGTDGIDDGADGATWRRHVRIDGDFFVESESDDRSDALLHDIEQTLSGIGSAPANALAGSTAAVEGTSVVRDVAGAVAEAIARHPDVRLVGTDAAAIAMAYARAVGIPPETGADAATFPSKQGASASLPVPAATPESASTSSASAASSTSDPATPASSISTPVTPATSAPATPLLTPAESDDFDERWARLWPQLAVVHDVPRSPAEQMATDERWAREVASGRRRPTLRIWEWNAPCVVVGRFQSIRDEVHEDVARAEGITVVRRCTGGGAMFIEPGNTITYSLYTPLEFVAGLSVEASYRLCDRWLVEALRGLGLDVRFAGLNDIASQHGKIGGAAQRRFPAGRASTPTADGVRVVPAERTPSPGAVLHHVTMAYDIDAAKMGRVLNVSREKMRDKAVRSAVKRVDPLKTQTGMTRDMLVAHLLDHCVSRGARFVTDGDATA